MAHGISVENWKWYIKNSLTDTAYNGPYATKELAFAALERFGDPEHIMILERVNIAALDVHYELLPQAIERGKLQPVRK